MNKARYRVAQGEAVMVPRDPIRVLHDEIKASPGGIAEAAAFVARAEGTFHNKLSEAYDSAQLTAREALASALRVQALTGRTGFAEAVAQVFGGVFVPVPVGMAGNADILSAHLAVVERLGKLSADLRAALEDNEVQVHEDAQLQVDGHNACAAIQALLHEISSRVVNPDEAEQVSLMPLPRGVRKGVRT